ncbi:unnamed protein product [Sphagnum balticum]
MECPDSEENFFSALSSARYVGRLEYSVRFRSEGWKYDHVLSLVEGNGTLSDLSILSTVALNQYDNYSVECWHKIQLAVSKSLNVVTAEFGVFDSEILQSLHKNRSLKNIKLDCGKLPSLLKDRSSQFGRMFKSQKDFAWDAKSIALLLSNNSSITSLDIHDLHANEYRNLLEKAICKSVTLEHLELNNCKGLQNLLKPFVGNARESPPNTSVNRLCIGIGERQDLDNQFELICEIIRWNKTLTSLTISNVGLLPKLLTSMPKLRYPEMSVKTKDMEMFLATLKENTTLRQVCFKNFEFEEIVQKMFLDMLEENTILEKIDLSETNFKSRGYDILVNEALERNRVKRILLVAEINMISPKFARVFICGPPRIGKTELRLSLIRNSKKELVQGIYEKTKLALSFTWRKLNWSPPLPRTLGIEKQDMIIKGDIQISLWDLGGQDEFHSLHDLVIPNTNIQGIASSFFLLCKLTRDKKECKDQLDEYCTEIMSELEYWIRFIASNTRPSIEFTPRIIIIFTFCDKVYQDLKRLQTNLQQVIKNLKNKYKELVNIYDSIPSFWIDARSTSSIQPLARFVTNEIKHILDHLPKVLEVCLQMGKVITQWNEKHTNKPMVSWETFEELCAENTNLKCFLGDQSNMKKHCQAVAQTLHEGGNVLYFENLEFVVMDPNWFCHEILGSLLAFDQSFRVALGYDVSISMEGFVNYNDVEILLQKSLSGEYFHVGHNRKKEVDVQKIRKIEGVQVEDLMKLMMELNQCYQETDDIGSSNEKGGIFIPSILKDAYGDIHQGERQLNWEYFGKELKPWPNVVYLGSRLECGDPEHTFLTVGFFPRLQVKFRKMFKLQRKVAVFKLEKNLIMFTWKGLQFFVEYSGQVNSFIDIIVRSSRDFETTKMIIFDDVITPIREFCGSSTFGCQGVKLVESILRPLSLETPWSFKLRKDQAVKVETLTRNAKESMDLDYRHDWNMGFNGFPPSGPPNKAIDLLGAQKWNDVVNFILSNVEELKIDIEEAIEVASHNSSNECLDMHGKIALNSLDEHGHSVQISDLRKEVMMRFDVLDNKLDSLQTKINHIHKLQKELLPQVCTKLDQILQFSGELQRHRVPCLSFFSTKDLGIFQKMIDSCVLNAIMQRVQLHFWCEHRDNIHKVEGQEGCSLSLETKIARKIRPYATWGLRIATMLMKAGAHITLGIEHAIPDLEKAFLNGVVSIPDLQVVGDDGVPREQVELHLKEHFTNEVKESAEQWLVDFLRGKDIATLFGLYRVQYTQGTSEGPHIAWVCKKHRDEGLRFNSMKLLPIQ